MKIVVIGDRCTAENFRNSFQVMPDLYTYLPLAGESFWPLKAVSSHR